MFYKEIYMKILKDGLSGLIRAKNEARFLSTCIDSCIDSLDELIVVYNDCSDNTEKILAEKLKQYPEKLKVFPFNHDILSHNLSKEEFEYAISLPEDSVRLHSTQCNYALSKVSYKYAMKIDPDQVYFADEIAKWRNVCGMLKVKKGIFDFIWGWLFMMYISLYRRISAKIGNPCLFMIPDRLVLFFKKYYSIYIEYRLQKGNVAVSFSGINMFYDGAWAIPFDKYNIHPPYNGEGDTLLFKVSNKTFFSRKYDKNKKPYAVVEQFNHPYKVVMADSPIWFHLHANRLYCYDKVKETKEEHPDLFVLPDKFVSMTYKEVHDKMDSKVPTLYQRILFALVHKMGVHTISNHIKLLEKIKLDI